MNRINRFFSNQFIKGGAILTLSAVIVNICNYFFHFLSAHSLGPKGYGEITTFFSYTSFISMPLSVLNTIFVQRISAAKSNRNQYVASLVNYFWQAIQKNWFIIILFLLMTPIIPRITNLSLSSSLFLFPFIILGIFSSFYSSILNAMRFFTLILILSSISGVLKIISIIPSYFNLGYTDLVIAIQFIATFCMLFVYYRFIRVPSSSKFQPSSIPINSKIIRLLKSRQFLITFLSTIGLAIFNTADILYVKKFFSPFDSGIYNSWNLLSKSLLYVLGPILQISFLFFAEGIEKEKSKKILLSSFVLLTMFVIGSIITYLLFPQLIIKILFGSAFNELTKYLIYSSFFGFLYATILIFNNYFLAHKSSKSTIITFLIIPYIILLFIFGSSLQNVIYYNLAFSSLIAFIYFLSYLRH
ncbi:hypothetical protein HZA75_00600 [Candidatus Roizmanbacteria bacterium]|nr:hypothetical protein [Candidatus Roizmanbacteria bacterium]